MEAFFRTDAALSVAVATRDEAWALEGRVVVLEAGYGQFYVLVEYATGYFDSSFLKHVLMELAVSGRVGTSKGNYCSASLRPIRRRTLGVGVA